MRLFQLACAIMHPALTDGAPTIDEITCAEYRKKYKQAVDAQYTAGPEADIASTKKGFWRTTGYAIKDVATKRSFQDVAAATKGHMGIDHWTRQNGKAPEEIECPEKDAENKTIFPKKPLCAEKTTIIPTKYTGQLQRYEHVANVAEWVQECCIPEEKCTPEEEKTKIVALIATGSYDKQHHAKREKDNADLAKKQADLALEKANSEAGDAKTKAIEASNRVSLGALSRTREAKAKATKEYQKTLKSEEAESEKIGKEDVKAHSKAIQSQLEAEKAAREAEELAKGAQETAQKKNESFEQLRQAAEGLRALQNPEEFRTIRQTLLNALSGGEPEVAALKAKLPMLKDRVWQRGNEVGKATIGGGAKDVVDVFKSKFSKAAPDVTQTAQQEQQHSFLETGTDTPMRVASRVKTRM